MTDRRTDEGVVRRLKRSADEQSAVDRRLREIGGGGTSGGVTDEWKASVDRQLGQLHGDVRALLYGVIGVGVFVLGSIGGLYLHGDGKAESVRSELVQRIDGVDTRLRAVEASQVRLEDKIDLLIDRTAPIGGHAGHPKR